MWVAGEGAESGSMKGVCGEEGKDPHVWLATRTVL